MRLAQIIIFLVGALAAVPDHVFIVLTPEIGCREISRILDEEKAGGQTMAHVDNAGLRIRYRVEGNGTPLVLLHGFTDSSETWYELGYVHALQPKHRLILIDSRGHGQRDSANVI